jgi:hypothetical protein
MHAHHPCHLHAPTPSPARVGALRCAVKNIHTNFTYKFILISIKSNTVSMQHTSLSVLASCTGYAADFLEKNARARESQNSKKVIKATITQCIDGTKYETWCCAIGGVEDAGNVGDAGERDLR